MTSIDDRHEDAGASSSPRAGTAQVGGVVPDGDLVADTTATTCEASLADRFVMVCLLAYVWFGAGFSISASQVALGLALIGVGANAWRRNRPLWRPTAVARAYGIFVLVGVLNLAWCVDVARALDESRKFLMILVFFLPYWARLTVEQSERLIVGLIGGAGLAGYIGVFQYIHTLTQDTNRVRAYGFFSIPLTFGEVLAMTMILTLAAWPIIARRPRLRLWCLLSLPGQIVGFILTLSRGPWVALGAGLLTMLVVVGTRRARNRRYLLILLVGAVAVSALVLCSPFAVRLLDPELLSYSSYFRLRIWQIGFSILADHPFGVGMNNVKPLYGGYVDAYDVANGEVHGHLHNNFLHYAVMLGWPGLLAFIWVWLVLLRELVVRGRELGGLWGRFLVSLAGLWVVFFTVGLTEYSYGDEEVCMVFFFVLGVVLSPFGPARSADDPVAVGDPTAQPA